MLVKVIFLRVSDGLFIYALLGEFALGSESATLLFAVVFVVPKSVLAGDIEKMIRQRGGKKLESLKLFDIYEGGQIKTGFKSLAYALVFRDMEKTLADDEVNAAMKKILNGLESMGIELRS